MYFAPYLSVPPLDKFAKEPVRPVILQTRYSSFLYILIFSSGGGGCLMCSVGGGCVHVTNKTNCIL
jgi:hypothetical protein